MSLVITASPSPPVCRLTQNRREGRRRPCGWPGRPGAHGLQPGGGLRQFRRREKACRQLSAELNSRPHAVTRRARRRRWLSASSCTLSDRPYTAAFGGAPGTVGWSSTVSFRGARYSVPDRLCDSQVWVRAAAGEAAIVAGEGSGVLSKPPVTPRRPGPGLHPRRTRHQPPGAARWPASPGPRAEPSTSWAWARGPSSTWSKRLPAVWGSPG